jgi:hypothetical protein
MEQNILKSNKTSFHVVPAYEISRDSSRDMTSAPANTKPHGVSPGAAVAKDGHATRLSVSRRK